MKYYRFLLISVLLCVPFRGNALESKSPVVYLANNAVREPYAIYYKFAISNPSKDTVSWTDSIVVQNRASILMDNGDSAELSTLAIPSLFVIYRGDTIYSSAFLRPDFMQYPPEVREMHYYVAPYSTIDYYALLCVHQLLSLWQSKYKAIPMARFLRNVASEAIVYYSICDILGESAPCNRHPKRGEWLDRADPL